MERKVSDATISRNVSRLLASTGLRSPCHIQVQTRNGEVTLSGTVQFVHQRNAAVQAIRTVEGVTRIVEKLKVTPPPKHQYRQPTAAASKEPVADEPEAVSRDAAGEQSLPPAPISDKEASQAQAVAAASPPPVSNQESPAMDGSPQVKTVAVTAGASGMRFTRSGDSYTFECPTSEEAERLRALLASFPDWLKKNSWVGNAKQNGDLHLVTFHAKSLIEFLRQQGF